MGCCDVWSRRGKGGLGSWVWGVWGLFLGGVVVGVVGGGAGLGCGPPAEVKPVEYNFAVVRQDGLIDFGRGVKPPKTPNGQEVNPRTSVGLYRIFVSGVHAYQSGVPLVFPLGQKARSVVWSRGGLPSLNYEMIAVRFRDVQGNLVDSDFVVVAAQGGVYGRLSSGGQVSHAFPEKEPPQAKRMGPGHYRVTTTAFQSVTATPVFLSLQAESWYGTISYAASGEARSFDIWIRDPQGQPADAMCAFWVPDPLTLNWAVVQGGKLAAQDTSKGFAYTATGAGQATLTSGAFLAKKSIGLATLLGEKPFLLGGVAQDKGLKIFQHGLSFQGKTTQSTPQNAPGFSFFLVQ